MYELIKEKFEENYKNNNYKRFDATHSIDIYVGYSDLGKKSLVIILENGNVENIESTRMINVTFSKREDEKLVLSFDLIEDDMSDLFYKFCSDIIESTMDIDNEKVLTFVINRWRKWISLFKNPLSTLLSEMEIRGLIGELVFLNTYMFEKYGYEHSLNAWIGTNMAHKDFEINDTWYEVKTTSQNGLTVKISSIEQLDSNNVGQLIIFQLEATNKEVDTRITLNSLISEIKEKMPSNLKLLFDKKLNEAKYCYDSEYDKYIFSIKEETHYEVNEKFPRIKKENLPDGIVRTNYELLIENIKDFKIVGE